jgi:hypothetical protein
MRGVYRYWWAHNQLLLRQLGRLLSSLTGAGVPTIVLKGAALAPRYYDDPGLRPMNDADVLVPHGRVREALAEAALLGLHAEGRVDNRFIRVRHGVSLRDSTGNTIDLHWAIHEDDVRPGADERAWETAVPIEIAGVATRMLAPAPLLLHACAHGAKWARDPAVRWVADAFLIIRAGEVDWEELVDDAVARHFTVRMRSCLSYLRVALDAAVPDSVIDRLSSSPVSVFERLEHQVRIRRRDRLGELPRYVLGYLRNSDDERGLLGFVRYLQYAWNLDDVRAVPSAAVRRAAARLRGRRAASVAPRGPRTIAARPIETIAGKDTTPRMSRMDHDRPRAQTRVVASAADTRVLDSPAV